jgi:hypothetical protein
MRRETVMMREYFDKGGAIRIAALIVGICLTVLGPFHVDNGWAQTKENSGMQCYRDITQTMVHGTAVGLGNLLKNVKDEKERIALIRDFIAPIRFFPDGSGYFYAYDSNCVNIAHATQKDLPGKNLYDHKDVKGKFVIRELLAAAKNGGGFVDFYWQKPGATGEQKKLGYVEAIPGTDYFIGSGVYLP